METINKQLCTIPELLLKLGAARDIGIASLILGGVALASVAQGAKADIKEGDARAPLQWIDIDGDGLADLSVRDRSGGIRLLRNLGNGQFEHQIAQGLLQAPQLVSYMAWGDVDSDGDLDLYLGSRVGSGQLFLNEQEFVFSAVVGSLGIGAWSQGSLGNFRDFDQDGRLDFILTARGVERVFRQDETGQFMPLGLGLIHPAGNAGQAQGEPGSPELLKEAPSPEPGGGAMGMGQAQGQQRAGVGGLNERASSIVDQSDPNNCISASSALNLGMLYPLSTELFVDSVQGNVGLGTTTPSVRLEVIGGDVRTDSNLVSTESARPPLLVSSSGVNQGLNVDLLDGMDSSSFSQFGSSIGPSELEVNSVDSSKILDGTIRSADFFASGLSEGSFGDGIVDDSKIVPNSLSSVSIALGAVGLSEIAANAVDGSKILDNSIKAVDLQPAGVGAPNIQLDSVDSRVLAAATIGSADLSLGSVGTSQLANGSVGGAELGLDAVTGITVADSSLTLADLRAASISGRELLPLGVSNSDFGNSSVDVRVLAANAVSGIHVLDDAVGVADLGVASVSNAKIIDNGVTLGKLAQSAVASSRVVDGSLVGADLDVNAALSGSKIVPSFGSVDISTQGVGRFGSSVNPPSTLDYAVRGRGALQAYGYLGVLGSAAFDGNATANLNAYHIGVVGISTGSSSADNYGVIGHSNDVGIRGESSFNVNDYGELGLPGVGAFAWGSTAGSFVGASLNAVAVSANNLVNSGNIIEASTGIDIEFRVDSGGNVYCDGTFVGGGADYAEWVEREDPSQAYSPGDVVGVSKGLSSLRTSGATKIMVISSMPVLVGNAEGAERDTRDGFDKLAFLGQAPVRVRGVVAPGDFIRASGLDDGLGVAIAPASLKSGDLPFLLGRSWERVSDDGVHLVVVGIGIDNACASSFVLAKVQTAMSVCDAALEVMAERLLALENRNDKH